MVYICDGQVIILGMVSFKFQGEYVIFMLYFDYVWFKDFFLLMKEFKCLESVEEIQCYVFYFYFNLVIVICIDLCWFEYFLFFFYKVFCDFGVCLWNGLYYQMQIIDKGIVGML